MVRVGLNGTRRAFASAVLLAGISLTSGCDDGSWESYVSKYEQNILKIDRLDEECQIVEGEGRGGKFYINIIDNSFVRSAIVPLDYVPSGAYPALVDGPRNRETAISPAYQLAIKNQERDQEAVKKGVKRAIMSIAAYQGGNLMNFGRDASDYCLDYSMYNTDGGGQEYQCVYAYSPKEHALTKSYPDLYDYSTNNFIPHDQPQIGYVARQATGRWSSTWIEEKAVCRPTEVKLR